jgi:hypothetical protein
VLLSGHQDEHIKLNPNIFHLLASSIWDANLRTWHRNLKRHGLEDIRRPSISTNDALHTQRAELLQILWQVRMTLDWLPPSVKTELDSVEANLPGSKYIH